MVVSFMKFTFYTLGCANLISLLIKLALSAIKSSSISLIYFLKLESSAFLKLEGSEIVS
jgi:hypothetical protein